MLLRVTTWLQKQIHHLNHFVFIIIRQEYLSFVNILVAEETCFSLAYNFNTFFFFINETGGLLLMLLTVWDQVHVSFLKFWASYSTHMPLPTHRQCENTLPAIAAYFWIWGGHLHKAGRRALLLPTKSVIFVQVFHSSFDQERIFFVFIYLFTWSSREKDCS